MVDPKLTRGPIVAKNLQVLSEGVLSLLPDQVRGAVLWTIDLDAGGSVVGHHVERALVRSVARFADSRSPLRISRAFAVSTRAACRSADCAPLANAFSRIFSTWACLALAAVCRRSAKRGSLRAMFLVLH